jgi:hypothetical protein
VGSIRAATGEALIRVPENPVNRAVLSELAVSNRPLKRAQYEAFEFRLENQSVVIRNGSHLEPAAHEYEVTIRNGIPVACTCPADQSSDDACKHRLAVAIRRPVLEAATTRCSRSALTDGGVESASQDMDHQGERSDGDCECDEMPDDFPCWPCVRDGRRHLLGEG